MSNKILKFEFVEGLIANEFEQMIETEYALCCGEMKRANKAAVSRNTTANRKVEFSSKKFMVIYHQFQS